MNFEKIQQLITDVIRRELFIEFEKDFEHRNEEEANEAKKLQDLYFELQDKLKEKLDPKGIDILNQLIDLTTTIAVNESEYYFERGVRSGLSDLNYLEKYSQVF